MKKAVAALTTLSFLSVALAAPSVAAGKKIYSTNCAACHGPTAKGVTNLGVALKDAGGWKYDLFKRALLQGKDDKGVVLKATMPKWTNGFAPTTGKAPTDDQMKSLQMFIKSVAK